jgi:hypothetical protein
MKCPRHFALLQQLVFQPGILIPDVQHPPSSQAAAEQQHQQQPEPGPTCR